MTGTDRIKGKLTVITGATSGIGKATAILFARYGSNLVLTGRRKEKLEELKSFLDQNYKVRSEIYSFDITDRNACKTFVESLKNPVDILVNNAGLASGKDPVYDADFSDWDKMIDTNIKGLLNVTRFVVEDMRKRDTGHIINIGSTAGFETYAGGSVYCATKHAVRALTQSMKKDFHGLNIRVSAVSPGLVETEFSNVRFHGDNQKADEVYRNMTPLTPEDVAEIILFTATRPPHVNILDTIAVPLDQSSSTMVHRSE